MELVDDSCVAVKVGEEAEVAPVGPKAALGRSYLWWLIVTRGQCMAHAKLLELALADEVTRPGDLRCHGAPVA